MEKDNKKVVIKQEQLESIQKGLATLAFALIALIGIQYIARDLLAPLLLSVFIAVLILPIFNWYRRRGISRNLSLILMILTFFGGAFAIVAFLTWSFRLLFDSLSVYTEAFQQSLSQFSNQINIDEAVTEEVAKSVTPENILSIVNLIVKSFGNIVLYFIFVPLLAIFMVLQVDSFPKNMASKLEKSNPNIKKFRKFADSIILYVSGRLKVNIITGTLFGASLLFLGVDFAVVWGFLTIIMSFIPYIGIAIASIPPILLAFSESGIVGAILVIVAVAIINLFAENVLDPKIQGKQTRISTATIILSLFVWIWLFGPIGAIMAIPMTVLMKMIFEDFKETQFLALLMEGNYDVSNVKKDKSKITNLFDKAVSKIPIWKNGK